MKIRHGLTAVAAAAALTFGLLVPVPATATSHWQLVGTHPDAAAQPTARGKTLHELHGYKDKVYVGYGDYDQNTGPIRHTPWNPATGAFEPEDWQDTEEVDNYQEVNGILWSPSIDPAWQGNLEGAPNASDYSMRDGNGRWWDYDHYQSWHVFDFRNLNGSQLTSGSSDGCNVSCATIWRSDNGAASWYVSYKSTRDASGVYGGDRCYGLATRGNEAWADCTSGDVKFNGSSWVADTTQQYGHKESVQFNGTLVSPVRGNLYGYNGSETLLRSGTHKWTAVDGAYLYAVDSLNRVWRTSDLSNWAQVATVGSGATSFTAENGVLYYGNASSQLFKLIPSASTTTTAPTC